MFTELWSLFTFLMPGFHRLAARFQRGVSKRPFRDGEVDTASASLREVGPFILRRFQIRSGRVLKVETVQ